jgi:hypothetical protein
MQAVIGETVKPEEFRVDQIRDISARILGGMARLTLIRWLYRKPAFLALCPGAGAGSVNR